MNHSAEATLSFNGQKAFIEFLANSMNSWPAGVTEMFHVNFSCLKREWEAQRETTPLADLVDQVTASNTVEPFNRDQEQFYVYLARTMNSWPEGVTEMFHKTTTCLKEEWVAQRARAGSSKQTYQDDAREVIVIPNTEAWLIQEEDGQKSATVRWDVAKHVPLPVTALIARDHFVHLQGELIKVNEQRLRAVAAVNDKQQEIDQLRARLAKLEASQVSPVGDVVTSGTD